MERMYPKGPSAIIFIAISMTNKPLNIKLLYSNTSVRVTGCKQTVSVKQLAKVSENLEK